METFLAGFSAAKISELVAPCRAPHVPGTANEEDESTTSTPAETAEDIRTNVGIVI